MQLLDSGGGRRGADGFNSVRKWFDAAAVNFVAEEIERGNSKNALGPLDDEAVGAERLEDFLEICCVLFRVLTCHEYVVDVDIHPWQVSEDGIHEALEVLSGIF